MTIGCASWAREDPQGSHRTYACQRPPSPLATPDEWETGCDTGCGPCDDSRASGALPSMALLLGSYEDSHRWLRPSASRESRDAWGRKAPLRVGHWTMVPADGATMEMSNCWSNAGDECWGGGHCACHPFPNLDTYVGAGGWCEGRENAPPTPELLPGCDHFLGHRWGNPGLWRFNCRRADPFQDGPIDVDVRSEGGRLPAFVRSHLGRGGGANTPPRACGDNLLIAALGRAVSTCPNVQWQTWYDTTATSDGSPGWIGTMLARVYIDRLGGRLAIPPECDPAASTADRARIDAINQALDYIERTRMPWPAGGGRAFDYLDHAGGLAGYNGYIGTYSGSWGRPDLAGPAIPPEDHPAYMPTLTDCRLDDDEGPVVLVDLVIREVLIDYHAVVQIVREYQWRPELPPLPQWADPGRPAGYYRLARLRGHARMMVRAELGVRATCPSQPGLIAPYDGTGRPPGLPPGRRIVYRDAAGRRFTPPEVAEWWGYAGRASVPITNWLPIYSRDYPGGANTPCRNIFCEAARALNALHLHGWPDTIEPAAAGVWVSVDGGPPINGRPVRRSSGSARVHYNDAEGNCSSGPGGTFPCTGFSG